MAAVQHQQRERKQCGGSAMSGVLDAPLSLLQPPLQRDLSARVLEALAVSQVNLDALLIYDYAQVDASALDALAEQLGLRGDLSWQLLERGDAGGSGGEGGKRTLLARALEVFRYRGTHWAVREALNLLGYGGALIHEGGGAWRRDGQLQRNGQNRRSQGRDWALYEIELPTPISIDEALALRQILLLYQPVRCHLRAIIFTPPLRRNMGFTRSGRQTRGDIVFIKEGL